MTRSIHPLTDIHPDAQIGEGVEIGPFCRIGAEVTVGDGCVLDSHVALVGRTTVGAGNRFFPGAVIGAEPQDYAYSDEAPTAVVIGERNIFREGVTIHRGADKEDGTTRIGSENLLMANSHVAHNCTVGDRCTLVNGVLLGGHVHVQDRAIISGNTVVHHFSTIGTLAFVSGGCRVPHDVPPYMLAAGSDNPEIKTINIVGMRRSGIAETTIRLVRQAFKLVYREHKKPEAVRDLLAEDLGGVIPRELHIFLAFLEERRGGRMGRGRENAATRAAKPAAPTSDIPTETRKAA